MASDKLHLSKKWNTVFIHLAAWSILFIFPLLFIERFGNINRIHNFSLIKFYIQPICIACIFYINYLWLIDKVLFRKKNIRFILYNLLLVVMANVAIYLVHRMVIPESILHQRPTPIPPPRPGFMQWQDSITLVLVVGADEQGDQVGVCQFLPQGRQVVVGDTGGGGAGPDQVQDVAAHGSRHPVVHGMVPVQAQGVGHPGHIAVFGVIMVVFLHVIALGGAGKVGVLQAHTGGDAVAQGNIGVGIFLCCKGRQDRQHQQSQGQQQADNTFFHKEPPCIASSEKDHFSRAFRICLGRYRI